MAASDDTVIAYLKANGLFDHLAAAAGAGASTITKDATAGDVHGPSGESGVKRTLSVAYVEPPKKKPVTVVTPAAKTAEQEQAPDTVSYAKRAVEAGDVVFEKGDANLYVSRPLLDGSADRLHDWAVENGIKNIVPPELMHVTQVHSKAEVDTDSLTPNDTVLDVGADGRWLSQLGKGNCLVMFFQSPDMQARFKEAQAAGASWDFPNFMPHVTISYDTGDTPAQNYQMTQAPDFPLQLGPESFQASNDNWTSDNNLVAKGGGDFEFTIDVSKADQDKQMIFGWASITHLDGQLVVDKQDDAIHLIDFKDTQGNLQKGLESGAYDFVLYSRMHGSMHDQIGTGKLVESMVFTPEKADLGIVAKNEEGQVIFGWWTGFFIDRPEIWKMAKAGKLPEFSIGGRATSSVL